MGIQINGNTNNINAGIGSLSIEDLNELDIVGVATAANFKTGVSNLHNLGLTLSGGQLDVGSNIKIGNAGVITATSFSGDGSNLTGISAGVSVANQADNRLITATGTTDALNGESGLTYSSNTLNVTNAVKLPDDGTVHFGVADTAYVRGKDSTDGYVKIGTVGAEVAIFTPEKTLRMNQCPALETTAGAINITGGGSGGRIAIQGTSSSAGAGLAEIFAFWGTNKVAGIIALSGADTTNKDDGQLLFYTSSSGPAVTERLRIKSDGKIQYAHATDNVSHTSSNSSRLRFFGGSNETVSNGGALTLHGVSHSAGNYTDLSAGTGGYIQFRSGTNIRMNISSQGYVTKPNHPAFAARLGSQIDLTTAGGTDCVFGIQEFDNSNSYDTSNGRFTAPIAGKYYFGVQIYAGFNGAGVRVLHAHFRVNGTSVAQTDMFGGASNHGGSFYHPNAVGVMMRELNANDYVTWNIGGFSQNGSGSAVLYASTGCRFFGHLVC